MFAKMMAEWLLDDEVKDDLIQQLNKEIDIPFINEKTEEKLLNALRRSREIL